MAYSKLIDLDLLSYFKNKLDLLFIGKVDKENGKGLSTNDYTNTDKIKLSNVESNAQANVVEVIQKNGVTIEPENKVVNIAVPVSTSDLINDSGFITAEEVRVMISNMINSSEAE